MQKEQDWIKQKKITNWFLQLQRAKIRTIFQKNLNGKKSTINWFNRKKNYREFQAQNKTKPRKSINKKQLINTRIHSKINIKASNRQFELDLSPRARSLKSDLMRQVSIQRSTEEFGTNEGASGTEKRFRLEWTEIDGTSVECGPERAFIGIHRKK